MIPEMLAEFVKVCRDFLAVSSIFFGCIVAVCLTAALIFTMSVMRKIP